MLPAHTHPKQIITHDISLGITAASVIRFLWRINEITRDKEEWNLWVNPYATNVIYIYKYIYIYMEHLFLMFLDHTQRRSTVGRTPLEE